MHPDHVIALAQMRHNQYQQEAREAVAIAAPTRNRRHRVLARVGVGRGGAAARPRTIAPARRL